MDDGEAVAEDFAWPEGEPIEEDDEEGKSLTLLTHQSFRNPFWSSQCQILQPEIRPLVKL